MATFYPIPLLKKWSAHWWRKPQRLGVYPAQACNTSAWVIGQPGTGKSFFLKSLVMQDIRQGRAVGLIDIHGDLFHDIRAQVAALSLMHPQLARRVVIVDPTTPHYTVRINPLEAIQGQTQERTALFLTDIVIKIWAISPNESPRLVWLLTNAFLALANLGLSLADFPRWLQDREWRNQHVPRITHEAVQRYWVNEFPRSDKEAQQWIAPATNKLGGVLFDSQVRHVLTGKGAITMRQLMDQGLILLVHVPKGILGEKSAHLLAAFIVAQIQKAALSRADTPNRRPFYLYLDEFQNYTTDYIRDVLAESRKYALALVLAHQFLDQLSLEMRSAVLNTAGTLISFRVGYKDARTIVSELFPRPDFPLYPGDSEKGSWEKLALELANLTPRAFWSRRRGPYTPTKKRTLEMPDLVITPQVEAAVQRLMELSGRLYGGSKRSTQDLEPHQQFGSAPIVHPSDLAAETSQESEKDQRDTTSIYSDIVWHQ